MRGFREDAITVDSARAIADCVDLDDLHAFLGGFKETRHWKADSCYFNDWGDGRKVWHGCANVAVYRYLVDEGLIETRDGKEPQYYNCIEFLYDDLLNRLVKAGLIGKIHARYLCRYDLLIKRDYCVSWGVNGG